MKREKRNVLCYLRTHRRVWGLTQKELASLLGFDTAARSRDRRSHPFSRPRWGRAPETRTEHTPAQRAVWWLWNREGCL